MYQAPARPTLLALPPPPAPPPGTQGVNMPCLPTSSGLSQGGGHIQAPPRELEAPGGSECSPLRGSLAGEGKAAWGKRKTPPPPAWVGPKHLPLTHLILSTTYELVLLLFPLYRGGN